MRMSFLSKIAFIWLGLVICLTIFSQYTYAAYSTSTVIPSTYKNYGTPRDLVTLPNGQMWYVDSESSRLIKIDADGNILRTIGRVGSGEGEFSNTPLSITRDAVGNLYALDACHVYKFDFNGGFIKSWGSCGDGGGSEMSLANAIHYDLVSDLLLVSDSVHNRIVKFSVEGDYRGEFGSYGTDLGQFDGPDGLTTDSSGNIYVVDSGHCRVEVFTNDGTPIRSVGSCDAGDNQLNAAKDVEVLSNGDIVVTSQNTPAIKKFSSDGTFLLQWGTNGIGEQDFINPEYMTKAADDSIWVSDVTSKKIQHYGNDGTFKKNISNGSTAAGKFNNPDWMDFDSAGNIYVIDDIGRVQKFDSAGNYIKTVIESNDPHIGSTGRVAVSPKTGNIFVSFHSSVAVFDTNGVFLNYLGTGVGGTNPGDFNEARGMAFDSLGNIYVADLYNDRVQKFDPTNVASPDFDGGYLIQFGSTGSGDGQFTYPENVFVDSSDNVYVSEWQGVYVSEESTILRVQKFNSEGVFQSVVLQKWGGATDQYWEMSGIFIDSTGKIYITDPYYGRVQVYDSEGNSIETIGSGGGDENQFSAPHSAKINPVTGDLVVVDVGNNRVQILSIGNRIKNLIPSADVLNVNSGLSVVKKAIVSTSPGINDLNAELYFGGYLVSDFNLDLSSDRDWASVNAITLYNQSKALVVNLNSAQAPGISDTHTLYIPYQAGQTYVHVCPEAATIGDVNLTCTNGYTLNEGDTGVSLVTVNDVSYWKVEGLTGTGGLSPTTASLSVSPSNSTLTTNDTLGVAVRALNDAAGPDSAYRGTVTFTSSPTTGVNLPANYTFTATDSGSHTFGNAVSFSQAGTYTITVIDTNQNDLVDSFTVTVNAGSADVSNQTSQNSVGVVYAALAPACTDAKPLYVPDLFQIDVTSTTAKLFFTPAQTNKYYISFSTKPSAEEHGAEVSLKYENIQNFKVNLLRPNTTYYIKVRGQNGCMPGDWSNIMKITTRAKGVTRAVSFYKNASAKKTASLATKTAKVETTPTAAVVLPQVSQTVTEAALTPTPALTSEVTVSYPTPVPVAPKKTCFLWWCW
jgi:sugar lactone lactonase YvrE